MTEEAGAVEAAEPVAVAEVAAPEPVAAPEAPKGRTTADALDRAFAKVGLDKAEPEAKADPEPKAEAGPARGPDGKFAPKEPASEPVTAETPAPAAEAPKPAEPASDAPARLRSDPEATAAWASAPPAVKAAVNRTFRELEGGLERYRQTVEPLRHLIEHHGGAEKVAEYMGGIAQFEAMLKQNPAQGMVNICGAMGVDARAAAAQIMGQPAPERDAVIDGLKAELNAVKQQVGTVHQSFEQQRQQAVTQSVAAFAEAHPRFDELSGDIATMLKTGFASDLADAYSKAERLNPAPQIAPAPAAAAIPPAPQTRTTEPPAPQTRKADISIQGAPGSDPQTRPRSVTSGQALDRAFAKLGLPG